MSEPQIDEQSVSNWQVRSGPEKVAMVIIFIVQALAYSVILIHLGRFATAPIYFVLTQEWHGQHAQSYLWWLFRTHNYPDIKGRWDALFAADINQGGFIHLMSPDQWKQGRHGTRFNWEGAIAGVLAAVFVGFNILKYQAKTEKKLAEHGPSTFSKITKWIPGVSSRYRRVTILDQIGFFLAVLTLCMVVAIPMNLWVAPQIAQILHAEWLNPYISTHPTIAQKLFDVSWVNIGSGIIVGFLSKFFGRPVLNKYSTFLWHLYVAIGGTASLWIPKKPRDYIQHIIDTVGRDGARSKLSNAKVETIVVLIGFALFVVLVGWGIYIFVYIA